MKLNNYKKLFLILTLFCLFFFIDNKQFSFASPQVIELRLAKSLNESVESNLKYYKMKFKNEDNFLLVKDYPELVLSKNSVEEAVMENIDDDKYCLRITLRKEYWKKFEEVTSNNINKKLAIVFNDNILVAPVIRRAISDGSLSIERLTKVEIEELIKKIGIQVSFNKKEKKALPKEIRLTKEGKFDEAINEYKKSLKTEKDKDIIGNIYSNMATCYIMKQDHKGAIECYKKITQMDIPVTDKNYHHICGAYFSLGNFYKEGEEIKKEIYYEKGLSNLDKIIKDYKGNYSAEWASAMKVYYQLGWGEIDEAINTAKNIIDGQYSDKVISEVYIILAMCYEKKGMTKEAMQTYKEVIDKYPTIEAAQTAKGLMESLENATQK